MKKNVYNLVSFIFFSILSSHSLAQQDSVWREVNYFQYTVCDTNETHVSGGGAVSMNGNVAIAGKIDDCFIVGKDTMINAGAAFIYELDTNGIWIQKQKITPLNRIPYSSFGNSVSIYGSYAIVGSDAESYNDTNNNFLVQAGAVYIFKLDNSGTWNQLQRIIDPDGASYDVFGYSVSIFNEDIIISSNSGDTGKVYFYKFNINSGLWDKQLVYSPPDGTNHDGFGCSVSISGNLALVGAPNYEQQGLGVVYTFKKDNNGVFEYDQEIANNFADTVFNFGNSVSVDGNNALIGASMPLTSYGNSSAYIYKKDSLSGNWILVKSIPTPQLVRNKGYCFGYAVSLSGNNAVIGCPYVISHPFVFGYTFVYKKENGVWSSTPQLLNGAEQKVDDNFGYFVSISGIYCFVSSSGSTLENPTGQNYYCNGAYYIFKQCDSLIANAGTNSIICPGLFDTLGGTSQNPTAQGGIPPYKYLWSTIPSSGWSSNLANPIVQPSQTTTYHLTVTDLGGNGIQATSEVTITINQHCPYTYPITFNKNLIEPALSTNAEGDVVLTGVYSGRSISFGNSNYTIYSIADTNPINYQRIFVGKFTKKGYKQWAHSISCSEYFPDSQYGKIIVDDSSNTFLVLYTPEQFLLENGQAYGNNNVDSYISVIKFGPSGNIEWVSTIGDYPKSPSITSSNDAIYLKGIDSGNGNDTLAFGNFIAKISKTGSGHIQWVIQDTKWQYGNLCITYAKNYLFLYYPTVISMIDTNGNYIKNCGFHPLRDPQWSYYFTYGGSNMFYLFSTPDLCDSSFENPYALSGLQLTLDNNGDTIFKTTKCVLGSSTWPSFAAIKKYAYIFYEGPPNGNLHNSIEKYNMAPNTSDTPIWSDTCSTNDLFSLAVDSTQFFGYYFEFHVSDSISILNQFDQDTGTIIYTMKDVKDSLNKFEQLSSNWTIYPIPANDFLKILYSGSEIVEQVQFEIYNSKGASVYSINTNNLHKPETTLDITSLPSGLYILRIVSNGIQLKSEKFVKY